MKTKITALAFVLIIVSFLSTCEISITPGPLEGELISGVETRSYHIKMMEPYVEPAGWIILEVDLTEVTEGSFCVTRLQYPWGLTSATN